MFVLKNMQYQELSDTCTTTSIRSMSNTQHGGEYFVNYIQDLSSDVVLKGGYWGNDYVDVELATTKNEDSFKEVCRYYLLKTRRTMRKAASPSAPFFRVCFPKRSHTSR